LTPGSGIRDGRKSASGSGIRDEQPGSYFLELRNHFFAFLGVKILKFFDEDPGSGMETVRIRDPGWKKVGSGIREKDYKYQQIYCKNVKQKMLNEGNQIHNFIFSSGSGTVITYGSGSDFVTSYGSGSTRQKVTVPTVPVPQH
jgi:hypothetical protein